MRYKYLQIFQTPETMESFNFDFFQTIVKQKPVEGNYIVNLVGVTGGWTWFDLYYKISDAREDGGVTSTRVLLCNRYRSSLSVDFE